MQESAISSTASADGWVRCLLAKSSRAVPLKAWERRNIKRTLSPNSIGSRRSGLQPDAQAGRRGELHGSPRSGILRRRGGYGRDGRYVAEDGHVDISAAGCPMVISSFRQTQ